MVADVVARMAASVATGLSGRAGPTTQDGVTAAATIEEVRDFLSELKEPPETEPERLRLTSTLHALDHAGRLAEILAGGVPVGQGAAQDARAAGLCAQAMRAVQAVGGSITAETALSTQAAPIGWKVTPEVAAALGEAEGAAGELDALQRDHRAATLAAVAPGELTAADALARIDTVRQLDALAHHAWRASAHLLGCGA